MKSFQLRFQPLPAETQRAFHPNAFFNPSLPLRLWDGIFTIPEALRKFFRKPQAPPQPEREPRKRIFAKGARRKLQFEVEVMAYPLRPVASHIPLRGELVNLSNTGVCVEFLKDVEVNHLFVLDFQLPEEKSVRLPGRVVWSRNRLSGFELLSPRHAKKILKESKSA